jgi:transcriptional regulator ATRX
MVLAGLLHKAHECDDKVLVFSQRLPSLDLIEKFLHQWSMYPYTFEPDPKTKMKWLPMIDYCRIDGSVDSRTRRELVTSFNDPDNYRLRLFLISTKAGGIGVNLTAANRVVIFDASWNPSDDIQAMWRVYRFGQDKPCYIYRLLAQGTMEEKIYMRQVAKQSLARRVVDEQQLDRHYSKAEIRELYTFQPDRYETGQPRNRIKCPADPAFASIINTCEEWISRYHEHDSLFQNRVDEALTPVELNEGWRQYDAEVKCKTVDTSGQLKIDPAILRLPVIHIHLPPNLDTSQKLKYIEQNPNLYFMCMREQIKKDIADQENEEYEDHIDYKNALVAAKKSKKKPKK